MRFYKIARAIFGPIFRGLFRVKLKGKENIPESGGFLVASNHVSLFDPILIGACVPRPVRFMAKKTLFRIPILHGLLKLLGAFPVNRGSADPSSLKKAISLIEEGDLMGIFPQGTRCKKKDPHFTEARSGAGLIRNRSGCDVIPVSIKTKNYHILPFRRVYITIGKPVSFGQTAHGKDDNKAVADGIFSLILKQLDGENV